MLLKLDPVTTADNYSKVPENTRNSFVFHTDAYNFAPFHELISVKSLN
jgi:hypothetical protein